MNESIETGAWTKVYEAGNGPEAQVLQGFLESHDVPVVVRGLNHRNQLGIMGGYIRLDVLVASDRVDVARELIREFEAKNGTPMGSADDGDADKEAPTALRPRSAMVALMLAFILPGVANLYAKNKNLGGWLLMMTAVVYASIILFERSNALTPYLLLAIPALIGIDAAVAIRKIAGLKKAAADQASVT